MSTEPFSRGSAWGLCNISTGVATLSVCSVVILLTVFWWAYIQNRQLLFQYREATTNRAFPPTLNGLKISIGSAQNHGLEVLTSRPSLDIPTHTIVIALSDKCQPSARVLPRWKELIERIPRGLSVEVVIISMYGMSGANSLAASLRAREFAFRVFRVTDMHKLTVLTGIRSTPETLVLDKESRLRFNGQTLNQAELGFILQNLSAGSQ